jgi:hypothetical protein
VNRTTRLAQLCFIFVGCLAAAVSVRAQEAGSRSIGDEINLIRWREDYGFLRDRYESLTWLERFKFLPLNDSKTAWLTLGGEIRERMESYDDQFFGLPPLGYSFTSFATRLLAAADLHLGPHFRAFAELGSFWESGRKPASRPIDVGDLELQQGFFDVIATPGADRLTLRFGRQEYPIGSGRLIAIRDAANVRLTFDAVKVEWIHDGGTLTAFAGRPVNPRKGVFDSEPTGRESFWNLDWSVLRDGSGLPNTEAFYWGREVPNVPFGQGIGKETRHNLGGRLWGRARAWDYSVQASYQFGTFKDASIHAWGVATDTGYSIPAVPTRPRFGLRADVASGDTSAHDDVLQTFEAPYPALNYFSEAAIFAPGNGFDVHPYMQLQPARTVTAEIGVALLWRLHKEDAIYRAGGGILIPPGVSDGRFVTDIFQIDVTWKPVPFLAIQGAFVRAHAGQVVQDAGGKTTTFFLAQTDLRF